MLENPNQLDQNSNMKYVLTFKETTKEITVEVESEKNIDAEIDQFFFINCCFF